MNMWALSMNSHFDFKWRTLPMSYPSWLQVSGGGRTIRPPRHRDPRGLDKVLRGTGSTPPTISQDLRHLQGAAAHRRFQSSKRSLMVLLESNNKEIYWAAWAYRTTDRYPKRQIKMASRKNCMIRPAQKSIKNCYFSSAQEHIAKKNESISVSLTDACG
jgi:hypothetical protein